MVLTAFIVDVLNLPSFLCLPLSWLSPFSAPLLVFACWVRLAKADMAENQNLLTWVTPGVAEVLGSPHYTC